MPNNNQGFTQAEIEKCRAAFATFDKDGSGTIDIKELKASLNGMGATPSDEDLFVMISQVDQDNSGEIDFQEFLTVIAHHKALTAKDNGEQDTLDAFVALGGSADKSGKVSTDKLRKIIKDFELTLDMDRLMAQLDRDRSGFLEFTEFRQMLA